MAGVCKQTIKTLKAGLQNSFVVGIIINSLNMRTFDSSHSRFNRGMRGVWTFTLRDSEDSEESSVNVTVWGSTEYVKKLSTNFPIGSVVEVINAKIALHQINDRNEHFVPSVSSPYSLTLNEGTALLQKHDSPAASEFNHLMTIPAKKIEHLQDLKSILGNINDLKDQYVDVLAVVIFVGNTRDVTTRNGSVMRCRSVTMTDCTIDGTIELTLWAHDWIERARSWKLKNTVLFLADARVTDNSKGKTSICIVHKTLITENPNIPEANAIREAVANYNEENDGGIPFAVDPNTITRHMTILEITKRLNESTLDEGSMQFAAVTTATVTEMNVDGPLNSLITIKCALCKSIVRDINDSCMNLECPSNNGTEKTPLNAMISLNVKVNLKDDTGYLIGCRLTGEAAECILGCSATDLQVMTPVERSSIKWKYHMEKCLVYLHIVGPSSTFQSALYNILSIHPIIDEFADEF